MKLTSMKLSKADRKANTPEVSLSSGPDYPYGLEVRLDERALKKLAIEELPRVGTKLYLMAQVEVRSVAQRDDSRDYDSRTVELQIQELALHKVKKNAFAELAEDDE